MGDGGRAAADRLRLHRVCRQPARRPARLDAHRRDALRRMGPGERLAELDIDRVDAEVLFPNRPWQAVVANKDAELHLAMVRAYNDWLSRILLLRARPARAAWPASPTRASPTRWPKFAAARDLPGIVGFNLSCYPHGDAVLSPDDDPLWAALEEIGKPVAIHVSLVRCRCRISWWRASCRARCTSTTRPGRMIELIFGGVLDRFPGLRFAMTEVDCRLGPLFRRPGQRQLPAPREGHAGRQRIGPAARRLHPRVLLVLFRHRHLCHREPPSRRASIA